MQAERAQCARCDGAAAVAGDAGVKHAVSLLAAEIDRDMAMIGAPSLDAITPDILAENALARP